MKKLRILILLMVFCCLQSIASYAQIRPKTISIGGYFGFMTQDITYKVYETNFLSRFPSGVSFAGDLEYHASAKIGIQALILYNILNIFGPHASNISEPYYSTFHIYGNIVVHLVPESKIVPYLSAGLGAIHTHLDWYIKGTYLSERIKNIKTTVGMNYGVGCDFFIKPHWLIRIDARFHQTEFSYNRWDIYPSKTITWGEDVGQLWYFQLISGLRYQF